MSCWIYDGNFVGTTTTGIAGSTSGAADSLNLAVANSGQSVDRAGGAWSVAGGILNGLATGGNPAPLTRPPVITLNSTALHPWGGTDTLLAWTLPGGWGGNPACFAAVLAWSAPGGDLARVSCYLAEARSSGCSVAPSTLRISRVDAGVVTMLGSVAWPNVGTHQYLLVFQAVASPSLTGPAVIFLNAHDLTDGTSATEVDLVANDPSAPPYLMGAPGLVAMPSTTNGFGRVRLYEGPAFGFEGGLVEERLPDRPDLILPAYARV